MDYETILYEIVDDVAFVRMNQPATLNAMTGAMGTDLRAAIGRAEREARALVLGGVGRGFCSGANLTGGGFDLADPERDAGALLESVFNPLLAAMRAAAIPIVTAVRGPAAGIGCGIALAGDLIVAGEGAIFYQAFRDVGLSIDGGSAYLLARAIGRPRAMEMMLLGERLPAAKALDWGLINRVVADDAVDAAALAIAAGLAAGPRSLGIIRCAAWEALDAGFEDALAIERTCQREAGRSEDFVEGVRAFQQKRPPSFRGR